MQNILVLNRQTRPFSSLTRWYIRTSFTLLTDTEFLKLYLLTTHAGEVLKKKTEHLQKLVSSKKLSVTRTPFREAG